MVTDCAPRPPEEPLGDGAAAALVADEELAGALDELELELQPAAARAATARAAIPT